jgi:hypothetical protein
LVPSDAEEEFVTYRFADDVCASIEQPPHSRGGDTGGFLQGEPGRIAAAGALAGNVVHVLDRRGEPYQRTFAGATQRGAQIMGNERAAHWG